MWTQSYNHRIANDQANANTNADTNAKKIWDVWTDVNRWAEWQPDLERARIERPFRAGTHFTLRPKGGPNVKVELLTVEPGVRYVDVTRFPLATMTGSHELIANGEQLEIRTTMTVKGPLAFLWVRLVARGIVSGLPQQTRALIERACGSGAKASKTEPALS